MGAGAPPRWAFICCFNTKGNPVDDNPGHPSYRPLEIWSDDKLLELGRTQWAAMKAGEWDEGLSPEAQEELEVAHAGSTTLTAGQQRALSKSMLREPQVKLLLRPPYMQECLLLKLQVLSL